jgi:Flp pilus assembly protein TadD
MNEKNQQLHTMQAQLADQDERLVASSERERSGSAEQERIRQALLESDRSLNGAREAAAALGQENAKLKQDVEVTRARERSFRDTVHSEAERLLNDSWETVKSPGNERQAYHEALRKAELANRLDAKNINCLNSLGAALYRVEKYPEARNALIQLDPLHVTTPEKPQLAALAFLALTTHHMANKAQAAEYLEKLRDLLEEPRWANNTDAQALLKEAETLVDPVPTGSAAVATPKVTRGIDLGKGWADKMDVNVLSVRFTADGYHLLVGGDVASKPEPNLWLLTMTANHSFQRIIAFKGHRGWVNCVALSPDGKQALSASNDGSVFLWDMVKHQPARARPESPFGWNHGTAANCIAFSPDGTQAAATTGNVVRVWNLDKATWKSAFNQHTSTVGSVAFSPDGKQILSADEDQTVLLWDKDSLQIKERLSGGGSHADFSPNGKWIVSGGLDRLWLWDRATGARWKLRHGEQKKVGWISFSSDSTRFLVTDPDSPALRLWDVAARKEICRIPIPAGQSPNKGTISPDGHAVACGIWRGHLYLFPLSN